MIAKQALRGGFAVISALCVSVAADAVTAGDYPPAYDPIQSSIDAERRDRARQLRDVRRQIETIDYLDWYRYGRWHGLDSAYAYGYARAPFGVGHVFEPWPYVQGDIWGYPWYDRVPQPIGRREIKTGPNRWESHPIYAPGFEETALERPVDVRDGPARVKPPTSTGPREF